MAAGVVLETVPYLGYTRSLILDGRARGLGEGEGSLKGKLGKAMAPARS